MMWEGIANRVRDFLADRNILLVHYRGGDRRDRIQRVKDIKLQRPLLLNHCEILQIMSALDATRHVPGDLAELGVAYGASARLIADYAGGEKTLHLFDTFEGLPAPTQNDSERFYRGEFRCSLENIEQWLAGTQIQCHKGLFPVTAEAVRDRCFSFVHLDADLYESTLEGLKFFYPRMTPGGIIISHDYLTAEGVNTAFRQFFDKVPGPVIELTGFQCMVVKL